MSRPNGLTREISVELGKFIDASNARHESTCRPMFGFLCCGCPAWQTLGCDLISYILYCMILFISLYFQLSHRIQVPGSIPGIYKLIESTRSV